MLYVSVVIIDHDSSERILNVSFLRVYFIKIIKNYLSKISNFVHGDLFIFLLKFFFLLLFEIKYTFVVLWQSVYFAVGITALALESPDAYFFEAGVAFGVVDIFFRFLLLWINFFLLRVFRHLHRPLSHFLLHALFLFVAERTEMVELGIRVELLAFGAKSWMCNLLFLFGTFFHLIYSKII